MKAAKRASNVVEPSILWIITWRLCNCRRLARLHANVMRWLRKTLNLIHYSWTFSCYALVKIANNALVKIAINNS